MTDKIRLTYIRMTESHISSRYIVVNIYGEQYYTLIYNFEKIQNTGKSYIKIISRRYKRITLQPITFVMFFFEPLRGYNY